MNAATSGKAMKAAVKIGVCVLLITAGAVGIARLRQTTRHLEAQVLESRERTRVLQDLRAENQRLLALTERVAQNAPESALAIRSALLRARRTVAELEQRADHAGLRGGPATAPTETSRDPETALTRLEYFVNAGRDTPSTAIQTLVWAATKGDEEKLAETLSVAGAAREKADILLARLPESERAKYTPESLAALAVTGELLRGTAMQIAGQSIDVPTVRP